MSLGRHFIRSRPDILVKERTLEEKNINVRILTNIKITVYDLAGQVKEVKEFHNLITTVGLNMIRDALYGDVSDCEIKYVEVGTGNTAPALSDTALDAYLFRKAVTTTSKPANYQMTTVCYIAPEEAIGAIEEIGWFCGAAAGAGQGTGILLSRVLYSRNKTALESLQIERTDTISEG